MVRSVSSVDKTEPTGGVRASRLATALPIRQVRDVLGEDLASLALAVAAPLIEMRTLRTAYARISRRGAFRLRYGDGTLLKARRVASPVIAERVGRILGAGEIPGFAKVIAVRGEGLLEEWTNGRPMHEMPLSADLLTACGALLRTLHDVPLADGSRGARCVMPQRHWAALEHDLHELVRRGRLDPDQAERLRDIALRFRPEQVAGGVIHGDFCPQNIVLAHGCEPVVVDNETISIGAYDYDLARVWYRWPATESEAQHFLHGYGHRERASAFLGHLPFWAILVVASSTIFRLHEKAPCADESLERLRRLAACTRQESLAQELTWPSKIWTSPQ